MTAPPFSIATAGPFRAEHIVAEMTGERRPDIAEVHAAIARAWEERLAIAAERGQQLWPGPMCRLTDWTTANGELRLQFGLTDYREFVGTNVAHPELAELFGVAALSNGCGVCGLVRTADGMLVLQHRSEQVFEFPGLVAPCGGAIEPVETPAGLIADPVAAIRREIEEELGITSEAVGDIVCLGLGHTTETLKPELAFLIGTTHTWSQLQGRRHEEHQSLIALVDTPEEVARALQDDWARYAPPGLLALTLREVARFAEGLAFAWNVRE